MPYPYRIYTDTNIDTCLRALRKHAMMAYAVDVADQQLPITFNERVGANFQPIRKAAGWSQATLADYLATVVCRFSSRRS